MTIESSVELRQLAGGGAPLTHSLGNSLCIGPQPRTATRQTGIVGRIWMADHLGSSDIMSVIYTVYGINAPCVFYRYVLTYLAIIRT